MLLTVLLTVLALLAAVFVGLLLVTPLSTSCTNVQSTVFVWPARVQCDGPPPPGVVAVVDEVLSRDGLADVLSPESVAALEDIARAMGGEMVVCALQRLIDGYSIPPGMRAEYLARAGRAQAFLHEHHIEVIQ